MSGRLTLVLLALAGCVTGAPPPAPPASSLLASASKSASKAHKVIFVTFGATWCKGCKMLEATLTDPKYRTVLDRYFVFVHLDCLEPPKTASFENKGAQALFEKWTKPFRPSGIPVYVILDPKGKKLAYSAMIDRWGNQVNDAGLGCEVFYTNFKQVTHPTAADLATVKSWWDANN